MKNKLGDSILCAKKKLSLTFKKFAMKRKRHKHLKAIINLHYVYVISYLTEDTVSLQYKDQSINVVMEITATRKNHTK